MSTGRENRPHIGIYGRCNVGKSSLLNYLIGMPSAIVSARSGTTTDPVRRGYEILGFGPVVFIDTGGLDDVSELGVERVSRAMDTLHLVDLAIVVYGEWGEPEDEFAGKLGELDIPFIKVFNGGGGGFPERDSVLGQVMEKLSERSYMAPSIFEGLVSEGDIVLLVCPVDGGAPAGRLILPQVQAIRALLDRNAVAVTVQPDQIPVVLQAGVSPKLVVTDSSVFREVRNAVPEGIGVTSFSILLAAAKGDHGEYSRGLLKVDELKSGDRVLIVENCAHQVSCDDIGRVKIPAWLREYTGVELGFTFVSGFSPLPVDMGDYALVVQCGGCMATRRQVQNRIRAAVSNGVAITNYGMLIKKLRLG